MLDSGVGGLGVARELRRRLPLEPLLYVGDTAHFPYGTKSAADIISYLEQLIPFFLQQRAKLLVLACNTASSVLLTHDFRFEGIPIVGVIEAGARVAARTTVNGRVGVLATEQTIHSGAYQLAIAAIDPNIDVIGQAAPELVEIVETGKANRPDVLQAALATFIEPLRAAGVDTLVLGCTHFLSLQPVIERLYPQLNGVINPADETVNEIAAFLQTTNLFAKPEDQSDYDTLESFYITGDDLDHFCRLGSELMGRSITAQRLVASPKS